VHSIEEKQEEKNKNIYLFVFSVKIYRVWKRTRGCFSRQHRRRYFFQNENDVI